MTRGVLVSIHDVTPAHEDRVRRILDVLESSGVRQLALLVVPRWHGSSDLREAPEFCAGLRDLQARGTEIFLHGLRHDEIGAPRAWHHHLRAFSRTEGEGEFMALSPSEAGARLDEGLAMFRDVGLAPIGFVPPAWLHGRESERLLRERGLDVTESSWSVTDVRTGASRRAPAFCWSTLAAWHEVGGPMVQSARLRVQKNVPLLRVAIHPPDVDSRRVRESQQRVLDALLEYRQVLSYREALATGA
jgi:uncharacterized protein